MFRHQHRTGLGERGQAAHLVGQLSHVAWPSVQHQELHGFLGQSEVALAVFHGVLAQVVVGQHRNLDAAFAQRRDVQADDVEAVEEVFAEAALRDQRVEVGVGGGDQAHVDA